MRYALLATVGLVSFTLAAPVPKDKEKERAVSNPAKDIHVVTDRDESVKEFFNRTRIVIGRVSTFTGGNKASVSDLLEAKGEVNVFASHPSPNDAKNELKFGTDLNVAPPPTAVIDLVKKAKDEGSVDLIFRKGDKGVYHLVGYTTRGKMDFFGDAAVNKADGYSPKDLTFTEPKK